MSDRTNPSPEEEREKRETAEERESAALRENAAVRENYSRTLRAILWIIRFFWRVKSWSFWERCQVRMGFAFRMRHLRREQKHEPDTFREG